jgi:transcriptional regulator with XRE-family HTH domain
MLIGKRLRKLREEKKLSQGDIENRSGVLRAYISRVEHGHTTPTIQTLEKLASALEIPLYRFFYDGSKPPHMLTRKSQDESTWGNTGKHAKFLSALRRLLSKTDEKDRTIILHMARKMASRRE